MSFKFIAKIWEMELLPPLKKLVLLKLADNANDDGECYPSYPHIAKFCGISRQTAIDHVAALVADNLIIKTDRFIDTGRQTSNLYILNAEKLTNGSNGLTGEGQNIGRGGSNGLTGKGQNIGPESVRSNQSNNLSKRKEKKDSMSKPAVCDDMVKQVIDLLNSMTGSKYKAGTKSHARHINGRIADGHGIEDLKAVIEFKVAHWLADPKMAEYLRPQTLFGPEKFVAYLTRAQSWIEAGKPRFINGEWEGLESKRKPMSNLVAAQRQARAMLESGAVSYDDDTPL
ncbi:MAG: conserved phage C-terminal domain-containing protein [Plesiomonas shigelloides]